MSRTPKRPDRGTRGAPRFFSGARSFRRWLEKNAATAAELWLGFYSSAGLSQGLTRAEAIDEALCFGRIDGLGQRIDAGSNQAWFSPRKARSTWSAKNIARVEVLAAEGRMQAAGLAAYERRSGKRSAIYSYEQAQPPPLSPAEEGLFKARPAAWTYFLAQPPGYRKKVLWWIRRAARPATRQRRLDALIASSAAAARLPGTVSPRGHAAPTTD